MSELIFIFIAFLLAGLIQGLIGFGFAISTTLFLVNRIDFTTLVFLNLSMSMVTSLIAMLSGENLRSIHKSILLRLMLCAFAGLALGMLIIDWVNVPVLKTGTLTVILLASVLSLTKTEKIFAHRFFLWINGFFSGVLTPSTGINGPLVALHLNAVLEDKRRQRTTMLAYMFLIMAVGVISMSLKKDFSASTWEMMFMVLVPSVAGYGLGLLSFKMLSNKVYKNLVTIFLVCSSLVSLIYLFI